MLLAIGMLLLLNLSFLLMGALVLFSENVIESSPPPERMLHATRGPGIPGATNGGGT